MKYSIILLCCIIFNTINFAFSKTFDVTLNDGGVEISMSKQERWYCKFDRKYKSVRFSSDDKFLLMRFDDVSYLANEGQYLSAIFPLKDVKTECVRNKAARIIVVPNYEIVMDANQQSGIYITYKEDLFPSDSGGNMALTYATIRKIDSSKEVIYPFTITKKDSIAAAMRKTFFEPYAGMQDEAYGIFNLSMISKNGKYVAPHGFNCILKDGTSKTPVYAIATRKLIAKFNNWFKTDQGVKMCFNIWRSPN